MEFKIKFNMDNAAFKEGTAEESAEVESILTEISSLFLAGRTSGSILDSNGNDVGEWEVTYRTRVTFARGCIVKVHDVSRRILGEET